MSCVTSRTWRPSLAAAALALFGGIAHAQAPWPPAQSNPAAQPDDVLLPMPCGGAMAFRRVNIPSTDALDDRRVQLGNPEPRFAYAENTRSDYVGGGFADPKAKNQRYYLIGKYEVTQLQYDALSATCPAARARTNPRAHRQTVARTIPSRWPRPASPKPETSG